MTVQEIVSEIFEKDFILDEVFLTYLKSKKLTEEQANKIITIIQEASEENFQEKIKKYLDVRTEQQLPSENKVEVVWNYTKKPQRREIQDFVKLMNHRFQALKNMLLQRQELDNATSIARIQKMNKGDAVATIGIVLEKNFTKNENYIFKIEDLTGVISVLITRKNTELYEIARDIQLDEVIGLVGSLGDGIVFANTLLFPDVPTNKELKKAPEEELAIFTSDVHFCSKHFLEEEFEKFLKWLNQEVGNEKQRALAAKVKYFFIVGDLIEGVGIFPNQENEITIKNDKEQFNKAAEYLKRIPEHITIVIAPGNHDPGRIADPQLPLSKKYAQALYDLPNVVMVSSPSVVNIGKTTGFAGFNILVYHGYSMTYFGDRVPSILKQGGIMRPDLIMKYLLQRRHLSPSIGSSLYVPDPDEDPLVINTIPDIFVTGHVHAATYAQYRNVVMMNCSCWEDHTPNTIKLGFNIQPAKILVFNLKTAKTNIINFFPEEKEKVVNKRVA